MGGRGIDSGINIDQITIWRYKDRIEVDQIIREAEIAREKLAAKKKKDERIPILYKRCCCCGEFTIPIDTEYVKCPICGWIDDEYQNTHIYSTEGMNELCLVEAKKLYLETKKNI